ncbi:MAG: TetR/AcrR family transcriptional regulator [Proteobacteria bacterium]|nr:TetR/AcrR family transcriptional regulator [Pseudomonadota bacterium]
MTTSRPTKIRKRAAPAPADFAPEPVSTRGQKRRELLKVAARAVLERVGYHAMKVTDVATEAGVAVGLFYHYFPDLKTVTCEVLSDFLDELAETPHPEAEDRFDVIFIPTLVWANAYEEHPGLMRCLVQVADEVPEFRALWNKLNATWSRRVAKNIARRFPEGQLSEDFSLSIAYSLGSMVDGLINEIYVHRNSDLCKLLKSPREVAELLSAIWYRALYMENPPAGKLTLTAPLHEMGAPIPTLAPKIKRK